MPWQLPAAIVNADIFALQALERGTANAAQQQRAIEFIERRLCATDRMSFYPGGDDGRRATDFAEGKRWVGSQIRRLLKLRPDHRCEMGLSEAPVAQQPAAEADDEA